MSLKQINLFNNLTDLSVINSKMPAEMIEHRCWNSLTKLKCLHLDINSLTDYGIAKLEEICKLELLEVVDCSNVAPVQLKFSFKQLKLLTNLKEIQFKNIVVFQKSELEDLVNNWPTKLSNLVIRGFNSFNSASIQCLANMKTSVPLSSFELFLTDLSDGGFISGNTENLKCFKQLLHRETLQNLKLFLVANNYNNILPENTKMQLEKYYESTICRSLHLPGCTIAVKIYKQYTTADRCWLHEYGHITNNYTL